MSAATAETAELPAAAARRGGAPATRSRGLSRGRGTAPIPASSPGPAAPDIAAGGHRAGARGPARARHRRLPRRPPGARRRARRARPARGRAALRLARRHPRERRRLRPRPRRRGDRRPGRGARLAGARHRDALPAAAGLEGGERPGETFLHAEGCGEVRPIALLEGWARHMLLWINRWTEAGTAPLRRRLARTRLGLRRGAAGWRESSGASTRTAAMLVDDPEGVRAAPADRGARTVTAAPLLPRGGGRVKAAQHRRRRLGLDAPAAAHTLGTGRPCRPSPAASAPSRHPRPAAPARARPFATGTRAPIAREARGRGFVLAPQAPPSGSPSGSPR